MARCLGRTQEAAAAPRAAPVPAEPEGECHPGAGPAALAQPQRLPFLRHRSV